MMFGSRGGGGEQAERETHSNAEFRMQNAEKPHAERFLNPDFCILNHMSSDSFFSVASNSSAWRGVITRS